VSERTPHAFRGKARRDEASRSQSESAIALLLTTCGFVLAGSLGQLLLCLAIERVLVVL
jgi:hypothetical protein